MSKGKNDGYLDAIQERMDGDVFRAMLEVMAQRVDVHRYWSSLVYRMGVCLQGYAKTLGSNPDS